MKYLLQRENLNVSISKKFQILQILVYLYIHIVIHTHTKISEQMYTQFVKSLKKITTFVNRNTPYNQILLGQK